MHVIMTDGGIDSGTVKWVNFGYFPYSILHKKWQYYLLNMVENFLGNAVKDIISFLWKKYGKGFVAYVTKGKVPKKCKGLAKYLAKYVASPPIAVSRIMEYDGKAVTYWYKDHETKTKKVETVDVFTFIGRSENANAPVTMGLVIAANQDPNLSRVYRTYTADTPQIFLNIDRTRAEYLKVPISKIFSTLQSQLGSSYVNDFNLKGRTYQVKVQADASYRYEVSDIIRLYVQSDDGNNGPYEQSGLYFYRPGAADCEPL